MLAMVQTSMPLPRLAATPVRPNLDPPAMKMTSNKGISTARKRPVTLCRQLLRPDKKHFRLGLQIRILALPSDHEPPQEQAHRGAVGRLHRARLHDALGHDRQRKRASGCAGRLNGD